VARRPEAAALARLYDLDLVEDPGDLDLYLALAGRTGDPILELAAGTGRLTVPLAAVGHRVTAVDLDLAMLERGRARAAAAGPATERRIEFIEADLVGLDLPAAGTFHLAFIALNSLFLLATRDAQREAFRTMARHLVPGGLAVADVWLPDADDLARFDGRLILEYERTDPETDELVTKVAAAQHDASGGVVSLTSIYESGAQGAAATRVVRRDALRLVSADELRDHAEAAGLEVETVAGTYDLDPIGPGSDRAIVVARRAAPAKGVR
jgi:SAM-dependent methyltransferase